MNRRRKILSVYLTKRQVYSSKIASFYALLYERELEVSDYLC